MYYICTFDGDPPLGYCWTENEREAAACALRLLKSGSEAIIGDFDFDESHVAVLKVPNNVRMNPLIFRSLKQVKGVDFLDTELLSGMGNSSLKEDMAILLRNGFSYKGEHEDVYYFTNEPFKVLSLKP